MSDPDNSFWILAIRSGYVCGGCNGVMPSDGRGSGPQHFPMITGELFPFRLCEGCLALMDSDLAPEISKRIWLTVGIGGRA